MKNEAILMTSKDGDWEGLFINGRLVSEGHQLGEGRKEFFWLNIGAKYQITGEDLIVKTVTDDDDELLQDAGSFPMDITQLAGTYR